MSFVKRNRIVSVRVTPEEYRTLDRISREHGANSVSEYLRQLIMSSEPFASAVNKESREVTDELDRLKQQLEQLSQLVKGILRSKDGIASAEESELPGHVLHERAAAG